MLSKFNTLLAIPLLAQSAPTCTNFTLSVTTQPTSVKVPVLGFDLGSYVGDVNAFASSTLSSVVTGTFSIAATYCEPEVQITARNNTLQFLIHGGTYTKNYWFGLHKGDQYSWVSTASLNGYPTIAIDRLGNGDSDHPDPTLDVQYPVQAACAHEIIKMARAGTGPFNRQFNKIILAGHSVGSITANNINVLYPADVNATILTGYSSAVAPAIPGILIQALPLPADVIMPSRYASLNSFYFVTTLASGVKSIFYGPSGTFDPNVFDYDYANRGTVSSGEATVLPLAGNTAHGYTAPVYLMTAEKDAIFCNLLLGLPLGILSGCTTNGITNLLQATVSLYPDTSSFGYATVPNAGHCWHLHYSAQAAFNNAHQWMTDHGF